VTTLASAPRFDLPDGGTAIGARATANGHVVISRPTLRWPFITTPRDETMTKAKDRTGGVLIAVAGLLLAALAVAMGIVSWHAQFAFVYAIKHQRLAASLEALGLDCGAVVFSILGIALARLPRRAVIERALVCICAAGSCAMNAAGSDLGSPRSVAAFIMPPVLFAVTSDRLISVIRRSALGPKDDAEAQRSAWTLAGRAALYMLRFAVAPPSTTRGARQALLNATPLPAATDAPAQLPAPSPAALATSSRPEVTAATSRPVKRSSRATRSGPTKTERLLTIAADRHDLAAIPLSEVSSLARGIAGEIDLHPGTARRVLLGHVRALQDGAQS
jgi:hypothetical protein